MIPLDYLTVWHFLLWIHYAALSVWTGGLLLLSFVVAPAVHRSVVSKSVAGEIVGRTLKTFNRWEVTSCGILLVSLCSSFQFIFDHVHERWILIGMVFFMGGIVFIYSRVLTPRMEQIKQKMPAFLPASQELLQADFRRLHRLYAGLMSLNLILSLIVLGGSIILLK